MDTYSSMVKPNDLDELIKAIRRLRGHWCWGYLATGRLEDMSAPPLQVLIVDDSSDDQEMYRHLLACGQEHEYGIIRADSATAGLAVCQTQPVDCILLDYRLPDLDGLEFLQALGQQASMLPCPVVMLTGFGSEVLAADAMKAGAMDYVPKNVLTPKSLERAITNVVEKFKLLRAVEEQRRLLEQTIQELRRRNEEIRSFYHVISHELKTPLTVIVGFLSIVLDGLAGPLNEDQREYLSIAKESCSQIDLALNDLLDVARLETGKLHISLRSVAIGDLVAQAVAAMEHLAEDEGIHLRRVIPPSLPRVMVDEKRIAQVLSNLLSNALKFTPEAGQILVTAVQDPQRPACIVVSVSDTGQGIPPEQCGQIFERLYQVRNETISNGGLGLGLYICRELIKLHGGDIWVDSVLGQGSTFSFTVPTVVASERLGGLRQVR
jgi:two-component system, sensor histidine kinase and response regulator